MTSLASRPAPGAAAPAPPAASTATLYRQMWAYAAGARGPLLLAFALLLGALLVKLLVPWLAAQAIDTLQKGGAGSGTLRAALPWLGAIVAAGVVGWALHGPGRVLERSVAIRVRTAITLSLYERLTRTPLAWHDKHHPGELQQRMGQSSRAIYDFTQCQFLYLQSAVNLIGPLVALSLLSPLCGGIAAAGFVVVAAVMFAFDGALMRLAHAENVAERRYAAALLDCLGSMSTLLSLGLTRSTRQRLMQRRAAVNAPLSRAIVLNEWKWCAVDLLTILLTWLLVAAYAWQASAAGTLLLGSIFMIYQYAQQAGGVVYSMASYLQGFARMRTDFAGADTIWAAPTAPEHRAERSAGGAEPGAGWQRMKVRDVNYEHAATDDERRGGVRHVSLTLQRGERVALVGPSGSGKSTLLRVLAGLYEAPRGHVEVDGMARSGLRDLGDCATLIPQEAQVFEGSVRDNIAFDQPHASASVDAALAVSGFDAVLATLPEGLDTPVVQGGFNFSGGQRQRLCLARGVLAAQGSSVLLLDEPTSALDPLTEALVFRRLDTAFPDACIVASVHRMSLLAHFDRVVLMVEGEVVDAGSIEDLLARQPLFRTMVGRLDDGAARSAKIAAAIAPAETRADRLASVA
ncbi:MAG TPA: ABC transporter ATP-binding protein [Caldimonas sp.]|jgi:ABC-type multidrug transport system fused ATPase/permease subunit|nr:ABC transporter ATP-binding protein [Caldimonas sp.]HEX2539763.1 ABC transporter ATP-binding protein [Caldimonas sp.]